MKAVLLLALALALAGCTGPGSEEPDMTAPTEPGPADDEGAAGSERGPLVDVSTDPPGR